MEEEKTMVIPLGGNTADGDHVQPTGGPVESAATGEPETRQKSGKSQPAQKARKQKSAKALMNRQETGGITETAPTGQPKKPGVAGRIFMGLGALIIFLLVITVIGGIVLFFFSTRDEMPSAPEIRTDMKTVAVDSAIEALKDHEIRLNSDEVNMFLETVKEKSAEKTAEHGIEYGVPRAGALTVSRRIYALSSQSRLTSVPMRQYPTIPKAEARGTPQPSISALPAHSRRSSIASAMTCPRVLSLRGITQAA